MFKRNRKTIIVALVICLTGIMSAPVLRFMAEERYREAFSDPEVPYYFNAEGKKVMCGLERPPSEIANSPYGQAKMKEAGSLLAISKQTPKVGILIAAMLLVGLVRRELANMSRHVDVKDSATSPA